MSIQICRIWVTPSSNTTYEQSFYSDCGSVKCDFNANFILESFFEENTLKVLKDVLFLVPILQPSSKAGHSILTRARVFINYRIDARWCTTLRRPINNGIASSRLW